MNPVVTRTLKYIALPGIMPRLRSFGLNFSYLAYLMALIFATVRLLPAGHPYLAVGNMQTLSIRRVLSAAAHNLHGGLRNIDQYIIFGGFVIGAALLLLQFVILFGMIAVHSAQASTLPIFGLFNTSNYPTDLAFVMLDSVFQVPGLFKSAMAPATAADITPFAKGMQMMFAFYSRGMLMVAGLIILYYFFVVVVETGQTGVPFGERFDSIYVPIRIVIAVLLLLPLSYGYNTGQHLTLMVAKWGSGFATNAWLIHNNLTGPAGAANPMGYTTAEMVVRPKIEPIGSVINFYQLAHACKAAYKRVYGKDINAYVVRPASSVGTSGSIQLTSTTTLAGTLSFSDNGPFKIIYGEKTGASNLPGGVKSYCGEINFPIDSVNLPGVRDLYVVYFAFLNMMWTSPQLDKYGRKRAAIGFTSKSPDACSIGATVPPWGSACSGSGGSCLCEDAAPEYYTALKSQFQTLFTVDMDTQINTIRSSPLPYINLSSQIKELGWGGAGIWFTKLADYNGALVTAAMKRPEPVSFPATMEYVFQQKKKTQPSIPSGERYSPSMPEGTSIDKFWKDSGLDDPQTDMKIARYLDEVYRSLDNGDLSADNDTRKTKNTVIRIINMIYGAEGLFNMRENTEVNPMSRLAALGRGIMEKSIALLGASIVLSGIGGLSGAIDDNFAKGFDTLSGVVSSMGMSGLTVGFILYYIIPLMPFLYFFFAVARWVKTIFEAMVGVPLWALAHLKIDGEGIPAQAAANGYFLLLEIMLRPILTVFGLLVAFSAFSALVYILDMTFTLVVQNVGGYDSTAGGGSTFFSALDPMVNAARGAVDEFLYTAMYAIIVYLIGTSCFKLIDLIPNGILRFAGAGVASFGDKAPDPLDSMTKYTAVASYAVTDDIASAVRGVGKMPGAIAGGLIKEGMQQGGRSSASAGDMAARLGNIK